MCVLSKLSYADIVATLALIVGVFALLLGIISFIYSTLSSRKYEKKFEEQTNIINDIKTTYQNHLEEEKKEKEDNIRALKESHERVKKEMNDYFKREQVNLGL